ncbi:MAG TPA: HAD-IIIA family hydrolase [Acidimicrobiia bacterium]|nr:HAD-IIIA family hydrolase [Acidimicrobiia bacterium]
MIAESRRHAGGSRPPESVDDVVIPAGVVGALASLRRAGYVLVVITNQPDVARGTTTRATVEAINDHLRDLLPIDAVYTCMHDGDDCDCRKPRPGLIVQAAHDHDVDLPGSWLIGDRWVDIAAGRAAGVRTVLLERDYSWGPTSQGSPPPDLRADAVGTDVAECVAAITDHSPVG